MSTVVDPSVLALRAQRTGEDNSNLAFLPNLVPTYRTDDGTGMFSIFHEEPHVDQGWCPMLRGLHLPKLLVCKRTIEFLETCGKSGGVEWKPLPPNDNKGSSGIVFNAGAFEVADGLEGALQTLSLEDQNTDATDGEKKSDEDSEYHGPSMATLLSMVVPPQYLNEVVDNVEKSIREAREEVAEGL